MLTVTNDAATAMRSAMERAAVPASTGMRISADQRAATENSSPQPSLRLDVATNADPADQVVDAPGGLQVFIAPQVVPMLEDKVLDGVVEPSGRAAFRITTQK
jgi:Fe-S cluster assembly iron-binding protein IscA